MNELEKVREEIAGKASAATIGKTFYELPIEVKEYYLSLSNQILSIKIGNITLKELIEKEDK